jgi:DNA-binding NarL/FixJ family response regulator
MLLSAAREERALTVDTMGELNLKPEGLLGSSAEIRVLIAEDFPAFRQFVCSTLTKRPDLQVIGEVSDGLEAVQKAVELKPDLILLDIGLPTMNGIEAARRIRALVPESKIIFLSQETSGEVVEEALSTGAEGYVVKAKAGSQLLAAIGAAMSDALLQ